MYDIIVVSFKFNYYVKWLQIHRSQFQFTVGTLVVTATSSGTTFTYTTHLGDRNVGIQSDAQHRK